jgi:hypothetical protein
LTVLRLSAYQEMSHASGPPSRSGRASAFAGLVRALWTGTRRMSLGTSRMRGRRDDGLPVYTYESVPGVPPVSAIRLGQESSPGGLPPGTHSHSHDFLVLTFHLERDGGSLQLGDREWQIEAGDVYLIAPGEIVDPSGLEEAEGWAVFFPPEVLGSQAPGTFLSWRAHPLLFPFVRGAAGGAQRLKVRPQTGPRGPSTCRLWTSSSARGMTATGKQSFHI